jgi:hypothetical protein
MKVPANDRMLLMKYTLLLINEGGPTRQCYAWGVESCGQDRYIRRISSGDNTTKTPTRNTDVWGTQFISHPPTGQPNSSPTYRPVRQGKQQSESLAMESNY